MRSSSSSPALPTQGLASEEERRARLYQEEVYPLIGQRLADLLTTGLSLPAHSRILGLGCGLGGGLIELMQQADGDSRCTVVEPSQALVDRARALVDGARLARRISFRDQPPGRDFPFADEAFDLVLASLAWPDLCDPAATVSELARVTRRGGKIRLATLTQGTWQEFLDVYRDVLVRLQRDDALASLRGHAGAFPEPAGVCGLLEDAGFGSATVERERWELVFPSAREFFYSSVIEQGPLPVWRKIAGKGAQVQDTFLAVKEALDTYFAGRPFGITVAAAMFSAERGA